MSQEILNPEPVLITKKAYEEGKEAFLAGLPITYNPRFLTVLRREWDRGWTEAKEESAQKDGVDDTTNG